MWWSWQRFWYGVAFGGGWAGLIAITGQKRDDPVMWGLVLVMALLVGVAMQDVR